MPSATEDRTEEELNELKSLVASALETSGSLGKIRAELRASVFLTLKYQEQREDPSNALTLHNPKLQKYLESDRGALAVALLNDFFDHFDLPYTKGVFFQEICSEMDQNAGEQLLQTARLDTGGSLPALDVLLDYLPKPGRETTTKKQRDPISLNDSVDDEEGFLPPRDPASGNRAKAPLHKDLDTTDEDVAKLADIERRLQHYREAERSEQVTSDHTLSHSINSDEYDYVEDVGN
eukprot:Clim_evm10s229 gene=Clim_evmTU10s229